MPSHLTNFDKKITKITKALNLNQVSCEIPRTTVDTLQFARVTNSSQTTVLFYYFSVIKYGLKRKEGRKRITIRPEEMVFPTSDYNTNTTFSITTVNNTSGETEDTSSSSLAVEAVILVLTISVPIILFIVVIFCSPSSKRREILNAMAARPANQNAVANKSTNQNNPYHC